MSQEQQTLHVAWPSANPRFHFQFHEPGFEDHIHDSFLRKGNFYEEDLLRLLASLHLSEGLVLDVGSYVGNHSIFFAGVMGRPVVSIEANHAAHELLCKNIEINGLSGMVLPLCLAAAHHSGKHFGKEGCLKANQGSMQFTSTCQDNDNYSTFEGDWIESVALDDLELDCTALIKIDVEGMELSVLEGLSDTISKFKPVLALECMTAVDFSQVATWCHERGYLPVSRNAATPVLVFAHATCYANVCHGCPPPHWAHLVP